MKGTWDVKMFCLFLLSSSWRLFRLWSLWPGPSFLQHHQAGGRAADLHRLVSSLGLQVLGKGFWVPAHTLRTTERFFYLECLLGQLSNEKNVSYWLAAEKCFYSVVWNKNWIWCQISRGFFFFFFTLLSLKSDMTLTDIITATLWPQVSLWINQMCLTI